MTELVRQKHKLKRDMMIEWVQYKDGWIGSHSSDFSAKVANEWKMKVAPTSPTKLEQNL